MVQKIKIQDGVVVYSSADPLSVGVDFKIKGQLTLGNNPYFPAKITTNAGHLELAPKDGDVRAKGSDYEANVFGYAGQILLNAGNAINEGVGGSAYLVAGDGPAQAGQVVIGGGYSSNGTGGLVALVGGDSGSPTDLAGIIQITAGTNTADSSLSGAVQFITNGLERFRIGPAGDLRFNLNYGTAGQVLTSAGPGLPTAWTTPSATPALPNTRIAYGSLANAITSTADFTYNDTTGTLKVGPPGFPALIQVNAGQSITVEGDTGARFKSGANTFGINSSGAVLANASAGTTGQVLTSQGTAAAPTWTSVGGSVVEPDQQIVYGTGAGVISASTLTYDSSTFTMGIGGNFGRIRANGTMYLNAKSDTFGDALYAYAGSGSAGSGGSAYLWAGDGTADGGAAYLYGGNGLVSSNGGPAIVGGGDGVGIGGDVIIEGGGGSPGNQGNVQISGGRIVVVANSLERLRILPTGAWSVGPSGTQTGTSGQVLTSAGTFAPPTWVTPVISSSAITINTQPSDYTLQLSDAFDTLIRITKATPAIVTIPNDSTVNMPIGSAVLISWNGLGQVTIGYEVGVIVDTPDTYDIGKQFGKITAIKTGANHWEIEGNLVPL